MPEAPPDSNYSTLVDGDAADERLLASVHPRDWVNPVAKPASLVLQVREAEIRKFRSLAASICLAQALVISYAFAATQERERGGRPAKGRKRA